MKETLSMERMQSLLETARILNSEQNTDIILNTLLDTCLQLVPGGDLGFIFLYNKQTNRLEMRADSINDPQLKTVSLKTDESMTGMAFTKKQPIFFSSNQEVTKTMYSMQTDNLNKATYSGVNPEKINGSIACPLIYQGTPLGVLIIDNTNPKNPLNTSDVDFIENMAVQATIAIHNAQIIEKEKENNQLLQDYTKIIEREKNNSQYSLETHKKFTNMVLEGSSIKDIITETSRIIGRDILLIDRLYVVRESSFYNDAFLQEFQDNIYKHIDDLTDCEVVIDYDPSPTIAMKIFPLRINKETYAWLCVLAKRNTLTELNRITLERAATIIALEMLKTNEMIARDQVLRGDFIENLIHTPEGDYVKNLCERFGLKKNGNYVTLIMKFKFNSDKESLIRRTQGSLYRRLNTLLKKYVKISFSMIKGSSVIVILDCKNADYKSLCQQLLNDFKLDYQHLMRHLPLRTQYQIAISQPFSTLKQFKIGYDDCETLIKMMEKYNKMNHVEFYDGLNLKQFLTKASHEELATYYKILFEPFNHLKEQTRDNLMTTLETYVKSNCNWTYTKNTLHIHGNTLTYRLSRISEILGMDLNDYHDRLKIQVAFEIMELI